MEKQTNAAQELLTKREYAAIHILQGMLAGKREHLCMEELALDAAALTDKLFKALKEPKPAEKSRAVFDAELKAQGGTVGSDGRIWFPLKPSASML